MWKFCGNARFLQGLGWIAPKLCGNCALPQNFHTRYLGAISVFYAVVDSKLQIYKSNLNCKYICCWYLTEQVTVLFTYSFLELKMKMFGYDTLLIFLLVYLESYHIVTCNCYLVVLKLHSKEIGKVFTELCFFRLQEIVCIYGVFSYVLTH